MMNSEEVFELKDHERGASVVFDTRFFPVFITHWVGTPSVALIDDFLKARKVLFERAVAEGLQAVAIADLSNFGTPPATVRKHLGDMGGAQDREYQHVFPGYVVVVPNAVVRGVVTALNWLSGDIPPKVYASSLEEAFSKDYTKSIGVDLRTVDYSPRP